MPTTEFTDKETESASFSRLLERLTGVGVDELAVAGRETAAEETSAVAETMDGLEDHAGVTYKPWPVEEKPFPVAKVRKPPQTGQQRGKSQKMAEMPRSAAREPAPARAEVQSPAMATKPLRCDPQESLGQSHVLESRRSTISIRLNEEETTLLRRRAVESGISVSEYVRSCVVEAEQLRLQVRQAVADMRLQPGLNGPNVVEERFLGVKPEIGRQGFWSQLMARIGALLGASQPDIGQAASSGLRFQ